MSARQSFAEIAKHLLDALRDKNHRDRVLVVGSRMFPVENVNVGSMMMSGHSSEKWTGDGIARAIEAAYEIGKIDGARVPR